MLMQETWKLQLDWDSILPEIIQEQWETIALRLKDLSQISFPRETCREGVAYDLLIFCDASQEPYGAVAYVTDGVQKLQLLMSKAKVAPVKTKTLPQLELTALYVGIMLQQYIRDTMSNIQFKEVYLWSDSEVALYQVVTRPFYESRVNWVTDPTPPASRRPAAKVSPAPTPAILMPSSGASSQLPRRQKSRRRKKRKAVRSANHNSASSQADLATTAERTANENSARRRATQPRSTANDLPEMKSTPVEHPHSFTSSPLTQPPISATNQNSGISSCQDHSEIWGLYKPAQTDPRQDSKSKSKSRRPSLSS